MEECHDLMTGPDMGQVLSQIAGSSIRDNGFGAGRKENLFSDSEKARVRVIIVITCNFLVYFAT